jgi:two-component system, sensor histidine kinase and response regulator
MADARAIDPKALAVLRELSGDDEFFAEMIDVFIEDTAGQLATFDSAIARQDASEVRRAAHSLKSNSMNFGASALALLCAEMEARGRDESIGIAGELLGRIRAEFEVVRAELLAMREDIRL